MLGLVCASVYLITIGIFLLFALYQGLDSALYTDLEALSVQHRLNSHKVEITTLT